MKKIAIMTVVLFLVGVGSAFAYTNGAWSTSSTISCGSSGKSLDIQLSNNVVMYYKGDATAGLGYLAGTYHSSGTRTYGSSSGDAKIYYSDGTKASMTSSLTVPTGTASAGFDGAGWSAL